MANKTTAYRVGPGKPPVHSRFKKGQSGNPGGKPGPAKSAQARLGLAIDAALNQQTSDLLDYCPDDTALDDLVKHLVYSAAEDSNPLSLRLLFALLEKSSAAKHRPDDADDFEPASEDKTRTSSLLQGESQGGNKREGTTNEKDMTRQGDNPAEGGTSGSAEGAGALPLQASLAPSDPSSGQAGA